MTSSSRTLVLLLLLAGFCILLNGIHHLSSNTGATSIHHMKGNNKKAEIERRPKPETVRWKENEEDKKEQRKEATQPAKKERNVSFANKTNAPRMKKRTARLVAGADDFASLLQQENARFLLMPLHALQTLDVESDQRVEVALLWPLAIRAVRCNESLLLLNKGDQTAMLGELAALFQVRCDTKTQSSPQFRCVLQSHLHGTYLGANTEHDVDVDKMNAKSMETWRVSWQQEETRSGTISVARLHTTSPYLASNLGLSVKTGRNGATCRLVESESDSTPLVFFVTTENPHSAVNIVSASGVRADVTMVTSFKLKKPKHATEGDVGSLRKENLPNVLALRSWINACEEDAVVMNHLVRFRKIIVCVGQPDEIEELRHVLLRSEKCLHVTTECELHPKFQMPTYRGLFGLAQRIAVMNSSSSSVQQLIMFANADIAFDFSQVRATISETLELRAQSPELQQMFITGRRRNCQLSRKEEGQDANETEMLQQFFSDYSSSSSLCALFSEDAQDYFIVNSDFAIYSPWDRYRFTATDTEHRRRKTFADFPDLVLGGIAFDNWFVSVANKENGVLVVDASASIHALHLQFSASSSSSSSSSSGGNEKALYASHARAVSNYNSRLAHEEGGGWAWGKTTLAPYVTLPVVNFRTSVVMHERGITYCPPSSWPCFTFPHRNQKDVDKLMPADAFARPWVHRD